MNKVHIKTKEINLSSISVNGQNYEVVDGVAVVDKDCVEQLQRHGFEIYYPPVDEVKVEIKEEVQPEAVVVTKPKAKGKKNV